MKRLMMLFVMMVVAATSVYAMARKPDPNTFQGCVQTPYDKCAYDTKTYNQAWQDPSWLECANKIYDDCRCKFRPDLAAKYNKKPCA